MYIHTREMHNVKAAEKILPLVFNMFNVNSVLDVGCGIGSWLNICEKLNINDYLGVDGDYVDRSLLMIPNNKFATFDLKKPLNLRRKFDLVISLEVAEHLPFSSADILIKSLIMHGDLILFSAAIPFQGGQNHLNEQWPSYWKNKFKEYGYSFYDIIRPEIWEDNLIEWWYKQNIFIVINNKFNHKFLMKDNFIDLVHPDLYLKELNTLNNIISGNIRIRSSLKILIKSIRYKFSTRKTKNSK